jgi:hypothetical protein
MLGHFGVASLSDCAQQHRRRCCFELLLGSVGRRVEGIFCERGELVRVILERTARVSSLRSWSNLGTVLELAPSASV